MNDWILAKHVGRSAYPSGNVPPCGESVFNQVQQGVKLGLTLEETRQKVDIASFRDQLTAGVASRKRNFHQYFEQPVVDTTYKQLKGLPTSESPF